VINPHAGSNLRNLEMHSESLAENVGSKIIFVLRPKRETSVPSTEN
jgi:hypothetical protein